MHFVHVLAIISCILLNIKGSLSNNVEDYIIEFGDQNIESTFEKATYSLVYFYKEECAFCSEFNPLFEYLSTLYNHRNNSQAGIFQILKTNGKINNRLNLLFKVERYPSLKLLNYESKAIITFKETNRDLESLINFISKETLILPNDDSIESNLIYLDDANFFQFLDNSEKETVVVFTLPYLQGWESYYFPNHFYQQLSNRYKDLNFALVDATKSVVSNITSTFHIADFPALMYFTTSGQFKVFLNKLQIQLSKNNLKEEDIESFISNIHVDSEDYGIWYDNTESLFESIEDEVHDNTKQVKNYGFNFRQEVIGSEQQSDLLEEYRDLLLSLEL